MMENRLSKRMEALARLVSAGARLADIGTDHGYIPIWLCRQGIIPSAIAMDINAGPLKTAEEHIRESGLTDRIETRLSDGLEKLNAKEADSVLIAGMGGGLIRRILRDGSGSLEGIRELILQPQSEIALTRRFLRENGWRITKEDMVLEDGKYYPMMKAVPRHEKDPDEESRTEQALADAFGPVLLAEKHPVLLDWLERERMVTDGILARLKEEIEKRNRQEETFPDQGMARLRQRREEMTQKRKLLGQALERMRGNENMEITLSICGEERKYPENITFQEIAREYQPRYKDDIVLVHYQNHIRELHAKPGAAGTVDFITTAQNAGRSTYRRSLTLLMEAAANELFTDKAVVVQHSIGKGYYCEFRRNGSFVHVDPSDILALKTKMEELAGRDLPVLKHEMRTLDAIRYFEKEGLPDKAKLLRYRRSSRMNVYELNGYIDYYYGYMVPSTGYIKYFDLLPYKNGFMLIFPGSDTREAAAFRPLDKLFQIIDDSAAWGESMGVRTVGELNNAIANGRMQELILVQESWMEQKIGDIAEMIAQDPKKKIILIAGPSSSGKTTFSHRLSIQLTAQGLKPHPIAMDDFYVNREDTPLDENGNYDFECLEAVDVALFNQCMNDLLEGKEVVLPVFNFKTGHREFRQRPLKLNAEDVLVIEGIHGLNEKLSSSLPKETKFKIYVSALTQLNIDTHNNLATTDCRLLRRIVRDARTRNTSARETLARWDSVRRGEEKNIFPYQEEADVMFNSALIYELAVLKCYAEPLLFAIEEGCPEYDEAKRLLKFLDYFIPVPGDDIALTSVLREFIGGGIFHI